MEFQNLIQPICDDYRVREEEDQAASITKPTQTELLGVYDEDEEKDLLLIRPSIFVQDQP